MDPLESDGDEPVPAAEVEDVHLDFDGCSLGRTELVPTDEESLSPVDLRRVP